MDHKPDRDRDLGDREQESGRRHEALRNPEVRNGLASPLQVEQLCNACHSEDHADEQHDGDDESVHLSMLVWLAAHRNGSGMSPTPAPRASQRLVVEAYGVRVGLAADRSETLERMLEVLPPGWRRAGGEPRADFALAELENGQTELRRDGASIAAAAEVGALLELIERDVRATVAEHSPR